MIRTAEVQEDKFQKLLFLEACLFRPEFTIIGQDFLKCLVFHRELPNLTIVLHKVHIVAYLLSASIAPKCVRCEQESRNNENGLNYLKPTGPNAISHLNAQTKVNRIRFEYGKQGQKFAYALKILKPPTPSKYITLVVIMHKGEARVENHEVVAHVRFQQLGQLLIMKKEYSLSVLLGYFVV